MRLDNLLLERDGAVAVLPTSRPRVLTLNTPNINELRDAVLRARKGIEVATLVAEASRLAALLVTYIVRLCALLAPCQPGASTPIDATSIPFRVLTLAHDVTVRVLAGVGRKGR